MKLDIMHPDNVSVMKIGGTIALSILVSDDNGVVAPHEKIYWYTDNNNEILSFSETESGDDGITENIITINSFGKEKEKINIFVRASSGQCFSLGILYMPEHSASSEPVIFYPTVSVAVPLFHSAPCERYPTVASGNLLRIVFPKETDIFEFSRNQKVWIQYVQPDNKGIAGQKIIPKISGGFELVPSDHDYITDPNGWLCIVVITKEKVNQINIWGDSMSPPYDAFGKLTVKVDGNDDSNECHLHASPSAGGPGLLKFDVFQLAEDQDTAYNQHQVLKFQYLHCDGSPVPFAKVSITTTPYSDVDNPLPVTSEHVTDALGYTYAVRTLLHARCQNSFIICFKSSIDVENPYFPDVFLSNYVYIKIGLNRGSNAYVRPFPDEGKNFMEYDYPAPAEDLSISGTYYFYDDTDKVAVSELSMKIEASDPRIHFKDNEVSVNENYTATFSLIIDEPADPYITAYFKFQGVCARQSEMPIIPYSALSVSIKNPATLQEWEEFITRKVAISPNPDNDPLVSGEPRKYQVTLTDGVGTGISESYIDFSITDQNGQFNELLQQINLDPPVAQTDPDGHAYVTITSPYLNELKEIKLYANLINQVTHEQVQDSVTIHTPVFPPAFQPVSIVSQDTLPLIVNAYHTLTATCLLASDKAVPANTPVYWFADPQGVITFSEQVSVTDSKGQADTSVMAYSFGATPDVPDITVYAHFLDSNHMPQKGSLVLDWQAGSKPTPGQAAISLTSVEGPLVASGGLYLLKATYRDLTTGEPLSGQTVSWQQDVNNGISLEYTTTATNDHGVAVNFVWGSLTSQQDTVITFTASVQNPHTHQLDSVSLQVEFTVNAVDVPQAGHMQVQIENVNSPEMYLGQQYTVSAIYTRADGSAAAAQDIYWTAFPADRVTLSQEVTQTNEKGISTVTIEATGTDKIESAYIAASTDNALSGFPDSAYYAGMFLPPLPKTWNGIETDKGHADNPGVISPINPKDPNQVITLNMTTRSGGQTVTLTTDPLAESVIFYDYVTRVALPTLKDDPHVFSTTSSDTGEVKVVVGAKNVTLCNINAKAETALSTRLAIATLSSDWGQVAKPSIVGLSSGQTLKIPEPNQGHPTTFSMKFPSQANIKSGLFAVLVNGRLAWQGDAEAINEGCVDIGYAILTSGRNRMAYLMNYDGYSYESEILTFNASGTPQTFPDSSINRTLPKPYFQISREKTIGAEDIVNGLLVSIVPDVALTKGDVISTFFYLSAYDANGSVINNVIRLNYTVTGNDVVSQGGTLPVILPQGLISGYVGKLDSYVAVEYSLLSAAECRWSYLDVRKLNTAL